MEAVAFSTGSVTAARDDFGRGGTTLWLHEGDGFTVMVFQAHDEPPRSWGLDEDTFDMIELRVVSAMSNRVDFWKSSTTRVTHKKWSWFLVCTDPSVDKKSIKAPKQWKGLVRDFDGYEDRVDTAEAEARKVVKDFEGLKRRIVGNHKPFIRAYKLSKDNPKGDRFWLVAVYPDDFHWIVRTHYGLFSNFRETYPRYWETGKRFSTYQRAVKFAERRATNQMSKGFASITDRKLVRTLRWGLNQAIEEAENN